MLFTPLCGKGQEKMVAILIKIWYRCLAGVEAIAAMEPGAIARFKGWDNTLEAGQAIAPIPFRLR
ncbi:MAG: hypothetical protein D6680_11220 [Cyanobacteria bacterium J007]|nr:MAG: hypothetical protein D6680_11220 [Cyanobacteria bacterium J007]